MWVFDKTKSFLRLIFFNLILVGGIGFFSPAFAYYTYLFALSNDTNLTLELSNANGNYYQHNMGTSVDFSIGNNKGQQLKDLGTLDIPAGKIMFNSGTANKHDWGAASVDFNVLNKTTGKLVACIGIAQSGSGHDFKLNRVYLIDQYKWDSWGYIQPDGDTIIYFFIHPKNPKHTKIM